MKLRTTLASIAVVGVALAGGWIGAGSGAAALAGRGGPSQPVGEGTVMYQRPPITRPSASDNSSPDPVALAGFEWISRSSLTFHPVVPCRVVDTRVISAPLANDGVYSFLAVNESTYAPQGGFAGDCGVPYTALAVEMNITAVGSTELGHLRLYPFGEPLPNASILNYSAGQNIANTATVGRCVEMDGDLCNKDFSVYAFKATHVIVDVLGYYEPPMTAQVFPDGSVYGASLALDSVLSFGGGAYAVFFDRDVSTCLFSATPGWGDDGSTGAVFVEVEDLSADSFGVYVATADSSGAGADFPFQLIVHC